MKSYTDMKQNRLVKKIYKNITTGRVYAVVTVYCVKTASTLIMPTIYVCPKVAAISNMHRL